MKFWSCDKKSCRTRRHRLEWLTWLLRCWVGGTVSNHWVPHPEKIFGTAHTCREIQLSDPGKRRRVWTEKNDTLAKRIAIACLLFSAIQRSIPLIQMLSQHKSWMLYVQSGESPDRPAVTSAGVLPALDHVIAFRWPLWSDMRDVACSSIHQTAAIGVLETIDCLQTAAEEMELWFMYCSLCTDLTTAGTPLTGPAERSGRGHARRPTHRVRERAHGESAGRSWPLVCRHLWIFNGCGAADDWRNRGTGLPAGVVQDKWGGGRPVWWPWSPWMQAGPDRRLSPCGAV